jgi:hypothetical protein
VVADDFCALDARINEDAEAAVLDYVVFDETARGLSAQCDEVVRDVVRGELRARMVVHAHSDEVGRAVAADRVPLCERVLRSHGQKTVAATVFKCVLRDFDALSSYDDDVLAAEPVNCKPSHGDVFDIAADRFDFAVLLFVLLELDVLAVDAYSRFRTLVLQSLGQSGTEVRVKRLGRFQDGAFSNQGDAIRLDGELFVINTVLNFDAVSLTGRVDSFLDRLAGLDTLAVILGRTSSSWDEEEERCKEDHQLAQARDGGAPMEHLERGNQMKSTLVRVGRMQSLDEDEGHSQVSIQAYLYYFAERVEFSFQPL